MKESNSEGVAIHTGPESCGGVRKDAGEALTGGRAGQVLSREIHAPGQKLRDLWGADAVEVSGRPHRARRHREVRSDPARSETLRMLGHTAHGNREIPRLSPAEGAGDRIGKSKDSRR